MKKKTIIIFMMITCNLSCSSWLKGSSEDFQLQVYKYYYKKDFYDHLVDIGKSFRKQNKKDFLKLSPSSKSYLKSRIKMLIANNEILLDKNIEPNVYILKSEIPFYFSLPDGELYLSTALIKKYIKDEGSLYNVLAFETIKSLNTIYIKNILVPTKHIDIKRILMLTKIPVDEKNEINKWVYYVLNRSGIDGEQYLHWIQLQNRNAFAFFLQNGDVKNTVREEYMFKNFLIKKTSKINRGRALQNSSRSFYNFINEIKRF